MELMTSVVESLEGETEGVWDIGPPTLESSPYGKVRPNTASDRRLASESSGHSTEDTNLEDAWENTLPLQVQVKSKVVVPCQQTTKPEEESRARTAKCSGTQRPVIFSRRSDWEKKKRLYVHSVMRHMQEKQGAHNGVMSELLSVMNRVAGEKAGKDGKRWQHPSDFTRRNYQSRFGTKPEMTLREWQRKNYGSHERFSKVPKLFERYHCPRL
ncbi:S100P-binding protein [Haplochromis burtoni]|uniref:S100P-binding protein n=1 Tax=Haplochromis burtoni TaxID=8153 RepID=UPI0003BD95E8|nr:S100P-binding protein [Haplochromis burtoni]XP_014189061.1 S100P-binding protein [Haplochromis burtoni]XP_042076745.1 S100P-binding protein [Haplochromis burtoni]